MKKFYKNHRFSIWCLFMLSLLLTAKICEETKPEKKHEVTVYGFDNSNPAPWQNER